MAQLRDAYQFLLLEFREDVNEFGFGTSKDHVMTEDQFMVLEQYCQDEVKKHAKSTNFDDGTAAFISTKDLILGLRERCNITLELHKLLFSDESNRQQAMQTINFYNQAKKVIIRSGGADKILNLKIFNDLLKELRIKLNITKDGFGPEKTMGEINFGFDLKDEAHQKQRGKRIERTIL